MLNTHKRKCFSSQCSNFLWLNNFNFLISWPLNTNENQIKNNTLRWYYWVRLAINNISTHFLWKNTFSLYRKWGSAYFSSCCIGCFPYKDKCKVSVTSRSFCRCQQSRNVQNWDTDPRVDERRGDSWVATMADIVRAPLKTEASWKALQEYFDNTGSKLNMPQMFAADSKRFDKFR